MRSMKAARMHAYGGPETVRVDLDVPVPAPRRGEIQVEVHASSVNPIDNKIRGGALRAALRYKLPRTLGLDVSGVVSAVGEGVTRFAVGDAVFASPNPRTPGTWAEFTCVRADEAGRKPEGLTHLEAAGLPLAFLTAWQALVDTAALQAGERVLIQAGAGGVGSLAIQIARHLGAHVITTCSARNAAFVKALGADEVIDYRATPWHEAVRDIDVVLDALGPAEAVKARKVVRRGGRIVGITTGLPERAKKVGSALGLVGTGCFMLKSMAASRLGSGVRTRFITRRPDGAQLDMLADLCARGVIRPIVDSIHPLGSIGDAIVQSESGRARGKIVIAVR